MDMKTRIQEKFKTLFGGEGDYFASAGRINLIGEHTDYNGGFVFPGAIDKGMIAEIRLNGTEKVRAFALDLDEYCEFGLKEEDKPAQSWVVNCFKNLKFASARTTGTREIIEVQIVRPRSPKLKNPALRPGFLV